MDNRISLTSASRDKEIRLPALGVSVARMVIMLMAATIFLTVPAFAQLDNDVSFITILKGTDGGIDNPMDRIITTDKEWQELWNDIHINKSYVPPPPRIDFTKSMIIIATMGMQPSPGHEIKITRITQVGNMVTVYIEETKPGKVCSPLTMISKPFHIVEADIKLYVTFRRSISFPKCVR